MNSQEKIEFRIKYGYGLNFPNKYKIVDKKGKVYFYCRNIILARKELKKLKDYTSEDLTIDYETEN